MLVVRVLAVAIAYFISTRLSHAFSAPDTAVIPVWLPSGVALAAVVGWGRWMLVGVIAADIVSSRVDGLDVPLCMVLAVSAAAEAAVGSALLAAVVPRVTFQRIREVLALGAAAAVAATVSASIGTTSFWATDQLGGGSWWSGWVSYWSSAATGILVVAPPILCVGLALRRVARRAARGERWIPGSTPACVVEVLLLGIALCVASSATFIHDEARVGEALILFPLLIWASLRFGALGASTSAVVVGTISGIGVHQGLVDTGHAPGLSLGALQAVIAFAALANLALAAAIAERDIARSRAEDVLHTLGEAQRLAHVGSWQIDHRASVDGASRVWCSDELARMFGLVRDIDSTVPLVALVAGVPADERAELLVRIAGAKLGGQGFDLDHTVRDATGRERVVTHTVRRVASRRGQPLLVGAAVDITERRALEAFEDALIATTSHELRTPLTSVLGFAATLVDGWDSVPERDRRRYVAIIDEQAHRLARIVDDAALQASIDEDQVNPHVAPIPVERVIRQAVHATADGGRDVTVQCEPGLVALGDEEQLARVVTNLLANARRFGQPPFRVVARLREDGDAEVRVVDHGSGVPTSLEPHLFQRFRRAATSTTDTVSGTGLGLSIARGLVEAVGGEVRYERSGDETAFVVQLRGG